MSCTFTGNHFSGRTLHVHPVTVTLSAGRCLVAGLPEPRDYPESAVNVSERIAQLPRFLYLPDGGSIETFANDTLDDFLRQHQRGRLSGLIHWLEQHSTIATAAAISIVVLIACGIFFGLPALAKQAARAVPTAIDQQAGLITLRTLDRLFRPTQLPESAHTRVVRQLKRLQLPPGISTVRIELRTMGKAPNAFALPGNILVVSDELVTMATDDELTAVIAHELGHLHHRHGLQKVFHSSAALLLLTAVTGDLSTLTTFTAALPVTLLQAGYSRDAEQEADNYAITQLRNAGIDPVSLATVLRKFEATRPKAAAGRDYFNTHPPTADRIQNVDPTGKATTIELIYPNLHDDPSATKNGPDRAEPLSPDLTPPVPITRVEPEFPLAMRVAGISGQVQTEFIVDTEGNVIAAQVISSTHRDFEAPAIEAIRKYKFAPGIKAGKPVNVRVRQDFSFNLDND